MKKTVLTLGLLTLSLMATDFSSMTTDELINLRGTVAVEDRTDFRAEMQSRVASMTAEERTSFRASRQAQRATPPTFSDMDKDNDGKITQTELDTARADRMAERSAEGKLLRNAGNAPTLATIDTNGDGSIDATEFASHQTAQMENRSSQQGQGRGQGGAGQQLHDGSGAGQGAGQGMMGRGMGHNR